MTGITFLYIAIFAFLLGALLLRSQRLAHGLIAIAGIIGAVYALRAHGIYAMVAPLLVAIIGSVQAARGAFSGRAHFHRDERVMLRGPLVRLDRGTARHLLDQGLWIDAAPGDLLAREGEAVTHLHWLARGEAETLVDDKSSGRCGPRAFIGEATVFTDEPASGTVRLVKNARLWSVEAETLRAYAEAHPEVRQHLDHCFTQSLADKLDAMSRPGAG